MLQLYCRTNFSNNYKASIYSYQKTLKPHCLPFVVCYRFFPLEAILKYNYVLNRQGNYSPVKSG